MVTATNRMAGARCFALGSWPLCEALVSLRQCCSKVG